MGQQSPHVFSNNGMWLNIGDSSSRMIGGGIKTDSKILLKSGNKTGVSIDSESWTESQIWANLSIGFSKVYNWSSSIWSSKIGDSIHDELAQDLMLTRGKGWNQVKTPESLLSQEVKLNH